MKRIEQLSYAEAEKRARGNRRLRELIRAGMTIVVFILLGLAYSLSHIKRDTPEFIVSIVTLVMSLLLFTGMTVTTIILKKRYKRYLALLVELAEKDEPDAWVPEAHCTNINTAMEDGLYGKNDHT
jgi:hypothetical protein